MEQLLLKIGGSVGPVWIHVHRSSFITELVRFGKGWFGEDYGGILRSYKRGYGIGGTWLSTPSTSNNKAYVAILISEIYSPAYKIPQAVTVAGSSVMEQAQISGNEDEDKIHANSVRCVKD